MAKGQTSQIRQGLEALLRQHPSMAPAIAVRAALRVLPLSSTTPILQAMRAAFVVWLGARYEWKEARLAQATAVVADRDILGAGQSPAEVAAAISKSDSAYASIYAAAHAAKYARPARNDSISAAIDATVYAATVAESVGDTDLLQRSIEADVAWLDNNLSVSALVRRPLWLFDISEERTSRLNYPEWIKVSWERFRKSSAARDAAFDHWIR